MSDPVARPAILLVEDEPMIRSLLQRMLEGAGYELIVATNGDDAVALARERSGPIDLLLTDVVMPRMDGFALSGHIASAHPESHVLFLSGYADESGPVRAGLKHTRHAFLLKPFTKDALLGKIADILSR